MTTSSSGYRLSGMRKQLADGRTAYFRADTIRIFGDEAHGYVVMIFDDVARHWSRRLMDVSWPTIREYMRQEKLLQRDALLVHELKQLTLDERAAESQA